MTDKKEEKKIEEINPNNPAPGVYDYPDSNIGGKRTDKTKKFIKDYTRNLKASMAYLDDEIYNRIFLDVATTKLEIIRAVDEVRGNSLVCSLLSSMVEDALKSNVVTTNIVNVTSKNSKIQKEIDLLDERFSFDELALDVAEDILAYGEFVYETKISNKEGLIDIIDNSQQELIIAITKRGKVESYLVPDEQNYIEKREPKEFIRFALGNKKLRVNLVNNYSAYYSGTNAIGMETRIPDYLKDYPQFVRIGRSILYPVLSKIRELELLEKLVPATKLSALSSGTIVGVQLPEGALPEDSLDICRRVEDLLNKKVGIDQDVGYQTVEEIIASSGRYKAIPIYGQNATLQRQDYKAEEPSDLLSSITDLRRSITSAMGFPYELIYGEESDDGKGTILKKYVRYLSILRGLQMAIITGIQDMILIHLANKTGSPDNITRKDIKVDCINELVNVNETEKLEFLDISISFLNNLLNFVGDTQNTFGEEAVNLKSVAMYMNDTFDHTGLKKLIKYGKINTNREYGERPDIDDFMLDQDNEVEQGKDIPDIQNEFIRRIRKAKRY